MKMKAIMDAIDDMLNSSSQGIDFKDFIKNYKVSRR